MTALQRGDHALVIGIADYDGLRPLQGPTGDAERMALWLEKEGGVPGANIELLRSSPEGPRRPVLDEIDDALDRVLKEGKASGCARRLYVYFAGHGCAGEIEHLALLMANANLDHLNNSMNAGEYRTALATRVFPEQVYFFDCCRNYDPAVTGRGPSWTRTPDSPPVSGLTQVVLYAAGFTEFANERHLVYSERRGLFTEALLEGLRGAAAMYDARSGEGVVRTDRLIPYVRDRLDQMVRQERVRQHLWHRTEGTLTSLDVAMGVVPRTQSVQVRLPPGTSEIEVFDDRGTLVLRNTTYGSGRVEVHLEMAVFTIRAQPSGMSSEPVRVLPSEEPIVVEIEQ
jgi:hypothetical protein